MGRAGRVAPRTCSTLELNHTSSMTLTLAPPLCKSSCPPSPAPVQPQPASATSLQQAWPQDVLQVVQQQLTLLRSHSGADIEAMSRKRGFEVTDVCKTMEVREASGGFEVELQAQPALPEDWEQFLDLKTGQLYYFHWSTCKRARQDPRELLRRAEECVQAHLLLAHTRMVSGPESRLSSMPVEVVSSDQSASAQSTDTEQCETTGCHDRGVQEADFLDTYSRSSAKINVCGGREDCGGEKGREGVMVALGCRSCSMFVMLSRRAPACPSCGVHLHPDHDRIG